MKRFTPKRFISRLIVELDRPVRIEGLLVSRGGSRDDIRSGFSAPGRPVAINALQVGWTRGINEISVTNETNERGYALVALMGIMLFSLILTTAAAPRIVFETQREKEEEMLWRGQQVAAALTRYSTARGGQYPTRLDELTSGIIIGTQKTRLLRPSALCDPMTPCAAEKESNWRLVYPGDPLVKELLEAYLATQMKPNSNLPPPPQSLIMFAQMAGAKINADGKPIINGQGNQAGLGNQTGNQFGQPNQSNPTGLFSSDATSGGMSVSLNSSGPAGGLSGSVSGGMSLSGGSLSAGSGSDSGSSLGFSDEEGNRPIIGVVSRKSDKMFRSYFGIEYYDHTLFFPTIPVVAGGFISPLTQAAMSSGSGPAPQCSGGGVLINGRCWGGLTPGVLCRGPNGTTIPCPR